jgi:exopolysaccharide production protein ExoZ
MQDSISAVQLAPRTQRPNPAIADKPTFQLVQALRALAALMVVSNHCLVLLDERLHIRLAPFAGAAGVDLFFVISGLVIALSSRALARERYPVRTFLARRVERIVPLYWLATTLKIVLILLAPATALNGLGSLWHVVSSYLFLPSFNRMYIHPVLIAGWTLNYEMFFYVLFAASLAFRVRPVLVVAPALVVLAGLDLMPHASQTVLWSSYQPIMVEFLYGILLAHAVMARRLPPKALSLALLFVGIAGLFVVPNGDHSPLRPFLWGTCAFAIVGASLGLEASWRRYLPAFLLEAGDASYAIYLSHGFVLPAVGMILARLKLPSGATIFLTFLAGIVFSTLAGFVVHRSVELPIMTYFRCRRMSLGPAGTEGTVRTFS